MMKTLLLLALLARACSPSLPASEVLQVAVEIPDSDSGGGRVLIWDRTDKRSHFHVLVTNVSDEVQRIQQDSTSWGWNDLRLEFTGTDRKTFEIHRATSHEWAANMPCWWILAPHEAHVFDVYFNDPADWEGFSEISYPSGAYTIRAMYELEASSLPPDDRNAGWSGKIASEPIKARLAVFH